MCGRYAITTVPEALRALFRYLDHPNFPPRYNVAPTQPVPIVRMFEGKRQFALVRWGLIPSWVKDPRGFSLLINARGESALEKPAFRNAMKRRRCLFPADGFYEWKREGTVRQPFLIGRSDGMPLTLAGLWAGWRDPATERVVRTFTIVTSRPNDQMADLHDRMPVVVPEEIWPLWLDPLADTSELRAVLEPNDDTPLRIQPVSRLVNDVRNDGPELIEPMAAEPPGHGPAVAARGFFD